MTARIVLLMLAAVLAAWTQAPEGAGQGKAAPAEAKGKGKGGRGATVDDTALKAKAIPPPQVMQLVRPGVYMVANGGANAVFQITPEGVILVNTKADGQDNFERLMGYIRGLTDQPVKYVFNTRNDPDFNGNNARFEKTGARIVSSDVQLGASEARAFSSGESVAVMFPGAKVLVVDDVAANTEALLKLDWLVAVPARGAPLHRSQIESKK